VEGVQNFQFWKAGPEFIEKNGFLIAFPGSLFQNQNRFQNKLKKIMNISGNFKENWHGNC
jgi:hypothetical protein